MKEEEMKVTLFFWFGNFLVVKMLFVLPEIWVHVWLRGSSRLEPNEVDQVSGVHFGHIYPLFNSFRNMKKLTPPIDKLRNMVYLQGELHDNTNMREDKNFFREMPKFALVNFMTIRAICNYFTHNWEIKLHKQSI